MYRIYLFILILPLTISSCTSVDISEISKSSEILDSTVSGILSGDESSSLFNSGLNKKFYQNITPATTSYPMNRHEKTAMLQFLKQDNKARRKRFNHQSTMIEEACKNQPTEGLCPLFIVSYSERKRLFNYKYTEYDKNNLKLKKDIKNAITLLKKEADIKHSPYATKSVYSPELTAIWNDAVNQVVSYEASNNIYRLILENYADLLKFNEFMSNDQAVIIRHGSRYLVELPDKKLEERINKLLTRKSGVYIVPIAFSMERLDGIHRKAVVMMDKGYLRNAPLIATLYTEYKKNVYVISGKKEAPKTTNAFGNLYIHEAFLAELKKYNILQAVLYHEAMHIKSKLLLIDPLKRFVDIQVSNFELINKAILSSGDTHNSDRLSKDFKWAEAAMRYMTRDMQGGHSEALRNATYGGGMKPRELLMGQMSFDLIREINIDTQQPPAKAGGLV